MIASVSRRLSSNRCNTCFMHNPFVLTHVNKAAAHVLNDSELYSQADENFIFEVDTSRGNSFWNRIKMYYSKYRITPKKSPNTNNVQKRRKEIEKSEKAAYWALFNSLVALFLYYDICYLKILGSRSAVLTCIEWLICILFATSACYDFVIHFWPYTLMRPIVISPTERRLLGVEEDEFGFKVQEPIPVETKQIYDSSPPFEIHYSFEEADQSM